MNTIKFILVILLPEVSTFGWLVILSFAFVSFGAVAFSVHAINISKIEKNLKMVPNFLTTQKSNLIEVRIKIGKIDKTLFK